MINSNEIFASTSQPTSSKISNIKNLIEELHDLYENIEFIETIGISTDIDTIYNIVKNQNLKIRKSILDSKLNRDCKNDAETLLNYILIMFFNGEISLNNSKCFITYDCDHIYINLYVYKNFEHKDGSCDMQLEFIEGSKTFSIKSFCTCFSNSYNGDLKQRNKNLNLILGNLEDTEKFCNDIICGKFYLFHQLKDRADALNQDK